MQFSGRSEVIWEPWATFVPLGTIMSSQWYPFVNNAQKVVPKGQKSIIYIKTYYQTDFQSDLR